jgi:hypothetical protein
LIISSKSFLNSASPVEDHAIKLLPADGFMNKIFAQFLLTLMATLQIAGFGRPASAAEALPVGGSIRLDGAAAKIIGDTLRL